MRAHVKDLRDEVHDSLLAEQVANDYRAANLDLGRRAMLDYAVKLTVSPGEMSSADVQSLRTAGFDDVAIHDIAQVTAYFNYINRIADGLGVDPEDFMQDPSPRPEHPSLP